MKFNFYYTYLLILFILPMEANSSGVDSENLETKITITYSDGSALVAEMGDDGSLAKIELSVNKSRIMIAGENLKGIVKPDLQSIIVRRQSSAPVGQKAMMTITLEFGEAIEIRRDDEIVYVRNTVMFVINDDQFSSRYRASPELIDNDVKWKKYIKNFNDHEVIDDNSSYNGIRNPFTHMMRIRK